MSEPNRTVVVLRNVGSAGPPRFFSEHLLLESVRSHGAAGHAAPETGGIPSASPDGYPGGACQLPRANPSPKLRQLALEIVRLTRVAVTTDQVNRLLRHLACARGVDA